MLEAAQAPAPDPPRPAVASCCKCVGKGLETAVAKRHTRFEIEACSADGVRCGQGGESFVVSVKGPAFVRARVQDKEDGTYVVEYRAPSSGPFVISVLLHGAPLPGSPFRLAVVMPRPDASQCIVRGDSLRQVAAREAASFEVGFVDALGQSTHAEELDVYVTLPTEGDDAGLAWEEQLAGTAAEQTARQWAREWALRRLATKLDQPVELIEQQVRQQVRQQAEAKAVEEAEPLGMATAAEEAEPLGMAAAAVVTEVAEEPETVGSEAVVASHTAEQAEAAGNVPAAAARSGGPPALPSYDVFAERVTTVRMMVRMGVEKDSAQTGTIPVGGKLLVLETRRNAEDGLRAFVLVQAAEDMRPTSPRGGYSPRSRSQSSHRLHGASLHRQLSVQPVAPPERWVTHGEWSTAVDTIDEASSVQEAPRRVPRLGLQEHSASIRKERSILQGIAADVDVQLRAATDPAALVEALDALTDEVLSATHGWINAERAGVELLARPHERVDVGLLRQHGTLWERRKATDKVMAKLQSSASGEGRDMVGMSTQAKAELKAGPTMEHELNSDRSGIGFAFGGVEPGTLHARGQVVKFHTVRFSIGLARKYWLHIGLRGQSLRLPGSPFLLEVTPGVAHARSSPLPLDTSTPVAGVVAAVGGLSCSMIVALCDRVGNRCTSGGAQLESHVQPATSAAAGGKRQDNSQTVLSKCIDLNDGTYRVEWQGQGAGTYNASLMISSVHLVGSPFTLTLQAGPPDVDNIVVSGEGLVSALAGKPALICLFCKDSFDNVATHMEGMSFGLQLLPKDRRDSDKLTVDSMAFESSFIQQEFEIRYAAREAGDFALHLWTDSGSSRRFLPGSPFAVRVSGVSASAAGSHLDGIEEYSGQEEGVATLTAGERLQLRLSLRDEFGNASSAEEGALVGYVTSPDGNRTELLMKPLRELGAVEITYNELTRNGVHVLNVEIHGQHVMASPLRINVLASTPVASKSRLTPPEEPPMVHSQCVLRLEAVDKYGNRVDRGGATIAARVVGTGVSTVTVHDAKDGSYSLTFSGAVPGECKVVVRLDNNEMAPLTVSFVKEEVPEGEGANIAKEREKEFAQTGDYTMVQTYAKLQAAQELSPSELLDAAVVRQKVEGLVRLGETKWRFRVVDEGETPRGAALEILTQADEVLKRHMVAVSGDSGGGNGGGKGDRGGSDGGKDEAELRLQWATEQSEIWMGLALTRLIFNGDKRSEDGTIKKLLNKALALRKEAELLMPLAETHNALGSLKQKQQHYREAEEQYTASLELRARLAVADGDEVAEKAKQQSVAQSLVSLGNLYAEMAESAPKKTEDPNESRHSLLEKALDRLSAARDAYVRGFAEMHPKLAAPWEAIGKVSLTLGKLVGARDAVEKAIGIREHFLPIDPASGVRPFNKDLDAAHKLLEKIEAREAKERAKEEEEQQSHRGHSVTPSRFSSAS